MGRCDRRERKSKAIRSRRRRTAYIALWGRGPNSDRMDACWPRLAPFLLLYSNFVARQRPTLSTLATSCTSQPSPDASHPSPAVESGLQSTKRCPPRHPRPRIT